MDDTEIQQLEAVADLLMGAAHADGALEGVEVQTVAALIGTLADEEEILALLSERVEKFEPDEFDLEKTCGLLELSSASACRALLSLLARVTDADDVQDIDEGGYIRRVADFMGVKSEDIADLAVEVISVSDLTSPPPLPEDAKS